jgi:hypothetical protein
VSSKVPSFDYNQFLLSLGDTKREDLVFVAFQLWVLGISIAALLNESIPHILASLVTHMMATAWAAFKITNTANFRSDFNRVVTHGACNGTSLLPKYWRDRGEAEIPSLVLNTCAMLASCYLTWKLIKVSYFWYALVLIYAGSSCSDGRLSNELARH